MPTAAKLVAAALFAALGYFAASLYAELMPQGTALGWFREASAAIGALCGWKVMGPRVGYGLGHAASAGLQTSVALVVATLFIFSLLRMVKKALSGMYDDDVLAALAGIFEQMIDYGAGLWQSDLAATLILGSLGAGVIVELVNRRWS